VLQFAILQCNCLFCANRTVKENLLKALIAVEVECSRSVDCSATYDRQIQTDALVTNGSL